MTGVIIRCPNCGTPQTALGECEACHEADTRYFCTNHEPGRWLDASACAVCGAQYGVKPAASPAPPRARSKPAEPWASPLPRTDERERRPVDAWSGPVRTPGRGDVFEIEPRGAEVPDDRIASPFPAEGLTMVATAAGCVRRIIVLFLILLALAALALFGLFGGGIQLF